MLAIPLLLIAAYSAWMLKLGRGLKKPRYYSILAIGVPAIIFIIGALVAELIEESAGDQSISDVSDLFFTAGLVLVAIALVALIAFALARRWEVVKGVGFSLSVTFIALFIELFVLKWGPAADFR
ncbi:hypothetical protein [Dehalogenimonas etheniformans]|uniref:Uncharacterized protein n=1 Tax=Dehalogenimonas etheniformans TaxID=1536648 RepID=A0A2P5P820_9CHLR|nr:hypothetical protein [Dehalogenimonas etheniformans]PPD58441.1 hypothetical protein JP09_004155 [Dehalogenimonas etheniformans]QNT75875.1 hypothetical protein HX448_03820 [Dehalogenimonas etheniformans]